MYIISVLMAYFIAVIIRDTWGEDIQKWERKHDKHMIYIIVYYYHMTDFICYSFNPSNCFIDYKFFCWYMRNN